MMPASAKEPRYNRPLPTCSNCQTSMGRHGAAGLFRCMFCDDVRPKPENPTPHLSSGEE